MTTAKQKSFYIDLNEAMSFLHHFKDHFTEADGWNKKEQIIINYVVESIAESMIDISQETNK
jgi:hypothetical protein